MHWLSPIFYMEVKPGPLEKNDKKIDINRNESSEKNSLVRPF